MVAGHWFHQLAGRFHFPDNFCCVDTETSGFSPERNLVCSIGHTIVRDRRVVSTKESYINWPAHPDVDHDKLRYDLKNVETGMGKQGKPFHHSWDKLAAEGRPAEEVFQEYLDMFEDMEERREILVMHNGWRFDVEFLQASFNNWLRIPFFFDEDLVYDTGVCEKASQLADKDFPLPLAGESFKQFAWRIGPLRRKGVKWALDGHCEEKYGLLEKVGADASAAHTAGHDSLVLAALFEEHRLLAGVADRIDPTKGGVQIVEEPNG